MNYYYQEQENEIILKNFEKEKQARQQIQLRNGLAFTSLNLCAPQKPIFLEDEAKNFVDQKESKSANSRRLKTTMAASGGGGGADGDEQTNPNSSVQPGLGGHGGRGHGGSGHHHHHHTGRHRRHKHGSGHGGNDVGLPLPERKLSPFEEKSEHSASPPGRSGPPPTKPKPINPMLHQQNSDERRMAYGKFSLAKFKSV